jgi:alkylation response protein AidB-like acyl-CoA dehydrogenase
METVDEFAARARAWLADTMPPEQPSRRWGFGTDEEELASVAELRDLQGRLYEGGFAGICFPAEYGGQGLPHEYQRAFNREAVGYELPTMLNVPTLVPCAAVILEFGTEEQKKRHLPRILRGEEIWMQFLSEPTCGSDVAGALTTAVRDGDEWVINGSKVWTTGAWWADWGLCLLRTNWDVPKHQGLSVFMVEIDQPGVEVQRIEMLNGSKEFCQEFMSDVRVSDDCRIGDVDDGWTIGRRWMFHERNAMGGGSPFLNGPPPGHGSGDVSTTVAQMARDAGLLDDPTTLDAIGEARMLKRAHREMSARIGEGMMAGALPDTSAAISRLMHGVVTERLIDILMEMAGPHVAAWTDGDLETDVASHYLTRQSSSIGGGTLEMARNNISERVLGMPRERTLDKDVPFRDVPKGPPGG